MTHFANTGRRHCLVDIPVGSRRPYRLPGYAAHRAEVIDLHCTTAILVHSDNMPMCVKNLDAVWTAFEKQ